MGKWGSRGLVLDGLFVASLNRNGITTNCLIYVGKGSGYFSRKDAKAQRELLAVI